VRVIIWHAPHFAVVMDLVSVDHTPITEACLLPAFRFTLTY